MQKYFIRGNGTQCNYEEMIKHIAKYIIKNKDKELELTIGTDSQNHTQTKIVEVVSIHTIGSGGIYFYHTDYITKIRSIKEKILEETNRSLNIANGFIDALALELIDYDIDLDELNVHFYIHCDIGHNGKTSMLISEIVNWVHAMGYDCVIKPDSYAASGIANKITK